MVHDFSSIGRGIDAFSENTPGALDGRVAQMLAMSTLAFGTREQVAALGSEADDLGAPRVQSSRRGLATIDLPLDQRTLDQLTAAVLQQADPGLPGSTSEDQVQDIRRALWRVVERTRSAESLLALLNAEQRLATGLDQVAASAALSAVPGATFGRSQQVLESALLSDEQRARELASVMLGGNAEPESDISDVAPRFDAEETSSSIAIHGTWARLAADRWYAPEGALHQLIRATCSPALYPTHDYFRWTGGYSHADRAQGSLDLAAWLRRRNIAPLTAVYAHSHGGNVALTAAAAGARIGLLVLLHTPALPRSDVEWVQIRRNVSRVVVMRTRLDYVLLGDGLRNGSAQAFDQNRLPHRQLMPHVLDRRGWISHTTFVTHANWIEWNLPREVSFEMWGA